MVMTYEQWQIILGIIDQKVNLSKDNIVGKIKELLKKVKILEPKEISRMLEEISHKLETSTNIPKVQETQEPLKKRLKVLNVPQRLEESEKILKEQKAQEIFKRILKKLDVREASGESKTVVLEDVLNARKISEKVPVMLDTKKILEALNRLKEASEDVYREWKEAEFDVNYWFTVNYNIRSGHDQHTLLSVAISLRLKNVVDALLELKEVNINVSSPFSQWTALHWAVENGDEEAVLKLIERGADVNQMDSSGRNPLYYAAVNGDIKIMELLVKNKANVNVEDIVKTTALYRAIKNGHKEAVELLMDNGAEVKRNGIFNLSPLHVAVINNYKEILKCLIERDKNIREDINIVNIFGWTPLYFATVRNNISLLKILLRNGADVALEDRLSGLTPLHIAAINGNLEAVELLLDHNKVEIKALKKELLKILLRNGADIDLEDRFSDLNLSTTNEMLETLEVLLEHKKEYVNMRDVWGYTAFDYAIINSDMKVVSTLIKYRASTNMKDPFKRLSAIFSCDTFVAYLILRQLDVHYNVMRSAKICDLHYAIKRGDMQVIDDLLEEYVADPNESDDLGLTALHYAAIYGRREVAKILISYGALVDVQDSLGITPLAYATQNRHWGVVEILRSDCANPFLQDNCGETVTDLAKRKDTSKFLNAVEKIIQANHATRVKSSTEFYGGRVTLTANCTARMQLEPNTELCKGRVTPLANNLARVQLEPSAEACPAKMDGIKERRANSKKRKFSTGSDSNSSTETDECNDRWSYRRSSRVGAVWKSGLSGR